MKVLLIIALINLLVAVVFWALWKYTKGKLKQTKDSLNTALDANYSLTLQLENLKLQSKIKSDNRKEANEKINALHNGDAVDNAINGLSVK